MCYDNYSQMWQFKSNFEITHDQNTRKGRYFIEIIKFIAQTLALLTYI